MSSGGGGATPRRVGGGSTQRSTHFEWFEAKVGPQRAITPKDGEQVKELTPIEHVRACLRIDEAQAAADKRPTLVYFHFPHEHAVHGAATLTMCSKVLDDEMSARWGRLFRCVQVDMAASDARLLELLGADGKPSIVVLDEKTEVVVRIPPLVSAAKMHKALKDAIQKFPERWKSIQKDVADQAKTLAEAKKAFKADDYEDALALLDKIRMSDIRIGEAYEESLLLGYETEQRIARAKEKEAEKAK